LRAPRSLRNRSGTLIQNYEPYYDYIILDSPAGIGQGFEAAVSPADAAFVVSTPDKVCVRSAAVAAECLEEHGVPARLIINRFSRRSLEKGGRLNIDDVIDSTGLQLIGVVPEDPSLTEAALTGGPVDQRRRGAKAILRIQQRMSGESVPLRL